MTIRSQLTALLAREPACRACVDIITWAICLSLLPHAQPNAQPRTLAHEPTQRLRVLEATILRRALFVLSEGLEELA